MSRWRNIKLWWERMEAWQVGAIAVIVMVLSVSAALVFGYRGFAGWKNAYIVVVTVLLCGQLMLVVGGRLTAEMVVLVRNWTVVLILALLIGIGSLGLIVLAMTIMMMLGQ